jgi:hypothetical protein
VPREITDEDIHRLDVLTAKQAENEAVIWGGPKGEGLVPSIRRMADSITELAATVAILANRVTGENGLAVEIRDLRGELGRSAATLAEVKVTSDKTADRRWQIVSTTLTIVVPILLTLLGRAIWIAFYGITIGGYK